MRAGDDGAMATRGNRDGPGDGPVLPPLPDGPSSGWMAVALSALAVAAVGWLAFANAMPAVAIHDDPFFVPARHGLDGDSLRRMFGEDTWAAVGASGGLYRPLALLSIAVDGALHGIDAAAYHRTNVLLHVAASLAVLALVRSLVPAVSAWPALLAAAVFAVHPIHAEAVDSVFNRSEILATIFAVAALVLVARGERRAPWSTWLGVAVLVLAALLSRESAISLPALAVLLPLLVHPGPEHRSLLRRLAPAALLAIPLAVYLWLRHAAVGEVATVPPATFGPALPGDAASRLVHSLGALREYARMMVRPWPLRVSYEDFAGDGLAASLAVHASLFGLAVAARRRAPVVAWAIAFFYVALLPSTRLFASPGEALRLGPFVLDRPTTPLLLNERVAYLPSVALAVLVGWTLARAAERGPLQRRAAFAAALAAVVAGVWLTRARNEQWRTAIGLYEAEVHAAPRNGDGWRHLVAAYTAGGRFTAAAAACDHGMEGAWVGGGAHLFNNCGAVYDRLGRDEAAIRAYSAAIALGLAPVGHANLGRVYARRGETAAAEAEFIAAAEAETEPVMRHYRRGQAIARFHPERRDEAIAEYREALRLQPAHDPTRRALAALGG